MLSTQQWTHSWRKTMLESSQIARNCMIQQPEYSLQSTMNFSTPISLKRQPTPSVLKKLIKWNICLDFLPNNLWLILRCSSTRARKVWIYSFGMMLQELRKWPKSQEKILSHIMVSLKIADLSSSIDVEVFRDGENYLSSELSRDWIYPIQGNYIER